MAQLFEEEDVFYDAVEYFGPSPEGEGAPVDPRNGDLFWVTHPDGPLEDPPPGPELDFPREDATQGLTDCLLQDERNFDISIGDEVAAAAAEDAANTSDDIFADDFRSSIAKLNSMCETKLALASSEPAAAPLQPPAKGILISLAVFSDFGDAFAIVPNLNLDLS